MKNIVAILLFALALTAHAADTHPYVISWTNSTTTGASNRLFISTQPFMGRPVTNALHKFDVGVLTQVPATLSTGIWRIGLVAVLDGIESDLAAIAIDVPSLKRVPEMPTMLRGTLVVVPAVAPRSRSVPQGHSRQRTR